MIRHSATQGKTGLAQTKMRCLRRGAMTSGLHAQQKKESTSTAPRHTTTPHAPVSARPSVALQRGAAHGTYSAAEVQLLQRTQGNRMVARMLQDSLTVGPANDQHEQEADRVAAQVMSAPLTAQRSAQAVSLRQPEDAGPIQRAPVTNVPVHSGGKVLPRETRQQMEARFGADFTHVRLHTSTEAAQASRSIDAEAFTHQNHIYIDAGNSLSSHSGQQLLAHELTHVLQQTGGVQRKANKDTLAIEGHLPSNRISTKKKKKKLYLDFLRLKRLDPQFDAIIASKLGMKKTAADKENASTGTFGHWWTEIGDLKGAYPGKWTSAQSFGWWPARSVKTSEVFKGVPGQLNHGDANDPHHGEAVKPSQMFHPVMELDPTEDYAAVRSKVLSDVRTFAKGYNGKWNWVFGWGKNCHTFQQKMNDKVGIHHQKGVGWFTRPKGVDKISAGIQKEQEQAKQDKFNQENPGIDFVLTTEVPVSSGMMSEDDAKTRLPSGSTVRILTDMLMGGNLDKVPGWQKVSLACGGEFYTAYKDDIVKHATRV